MSKSIIGEQLRAERPEVQKAGTVSRTRKPKPRFGLPEGFSPRLHRYGRSVLLEDDIYRLPSGQEFIPKYRTGTLGKLHHLYALLTVNNSKMAGGVPSIFERMAGFSTTVWTMVTRCVTVFDTGYTIHDLERPEDMLRRLDQKADKTMS